MTKLFLSLSILVTLNLFANSSDFNDHLEIYEDLEYERHENKSAYDAPEYLNTSTSSLNNQAAFSINNKDKKSVVRVDRELDQFLENISGLNPIHSIECYTDGKPSERLGLDSYGIIKNERQDWSLQLILGNQKVIMQIYDSIPYSISHVSGSSFLTLNFNYSQKMTLVTNPSHRELHIERTDLGSTNVCIYKAFHRFDI